MDRKLVGKKESFIFVDENTDYAIGRKEINMETLKVKSYRQKVRCFFNEVLSKLEEDINGFVEENNIYSFDIKFSFFCDKYRNYYSALLIYEEEVE